MDWGPGPKARLAKMDADSALAVTKDGRHLELELLSGSTWWPSDVSLPLGQPRTIDLHVLG